MKAYEMKNLKKVAAFTAALLMVGIPTGCSNTADTSSGSSTASAAATADENGETVLKVGYTREPSSFDPADFTSVASCFAGYDCYDTLLNFTADGTDVEPALAESWEQVDDTTYTYKIREGVKFADGNELTMDDVLFSLNRVKEDGYYMSYLFASVESFEVDEATRTLTVHLSHPDSTWKYVPAASPCCIMEKSVVEAEGDKYGSAEGSAAGTGPYKLVSWASGSEIVMEKNENWWGGSDNLDIDRIEFYIIEDESALALAAKSGQVDLVYGISNDVKSVYDSTDKINVITCEGTTANYIAFNTAQEPFNDVNARKAVISCIDKSQVTSVIGGAYASEAGTVVLPSSMMYMDKDMWDKTISESASYSQDYDKAAEYLAQSAYPDGFSFDYICNSNNKKQAEFLKSMIDASGSITMNIVEVPSSEYFSYMYGYTLDENENRYYDAVGTYMMSDYLDPYGLLGTMYLDSNAVQGGTNQALWTNAEADGYLDAALSSDDVSVKMDNYTKAYRIYADECPYLDLYTGIDTYALNTNFTYTPSPMFWYNFTYADVHTAK